MTHSADDAVLPSAHNTVQERDAHFARIAENAPGALCQYVMRPDGTSFFSYLSAAAADIYGLYVHDLLNDGQTVITHAHPDDRDELVAAIERSRDGLEPFQWQGRIVGVDGVTRWLHGAGRPFRRADGATVWDGMVIDVTAWREAEARAAALEVRHDAHVRAAQATEQQLTRIIESVTEGFVAVNRDWQVTYMNHMAEQILRRPRSHWLGRSIWEEFPEARGTRFEFEFNRALQDNVSVVFVEYFATLDGWFELRVFPSDEGMSIYFRDVTARLESEKSLKAAKEEAERANAAKSEFLSRISQELRTPLNSIIGFGALLEPRLAQPQDRAYATQIATAGRHLLLLINDILEFSRIDSGEVSLSLEPVIVRNLVQQVLALLERDADLVARMGPRKPGDPTSAVRGVSVNATAALQSSAVVWGDHARLTQVLFNLLANAIQFNVSHGSVALTCDSVSVQRVRLNVIDTGPGLTEAQQERMWIPFDRLSAGESPDAHAGSGIGLTLARGLVRRMGGNIGCDSAAGRGARFWIELPAYAAVAPPYEVGVPEGAESVEAGLRQFSVLYVEDNWSNFHLVERIFEERPHITLYGATDGELALNLVRRHRPDLILLDIHLPDMRGEDLLTLLTAQGFGDIPVVVVTADVNRVRARALQKMGAKAYLTKPIEILEFLRIVDAVLNGKEISTT